MCDTLVFFYKRITNKHIFGYQLKNQPDRGNLSAKDLDLKSIRTTLTHSEDGLQYIYLCWSPGVIMITVSRDALSSDRADTAEYKLKENQIFQSQKGWWKWGRGRIFPSISFISLLQVCRGDSASGNLMEIMQTEWRDFYYEVE